MDRLDPILDNDVLVAAWRATLRGSSSAKDHAALTLLYDPSHVWILTPTVYMEFMKVSTGSASRKRFLRKLANVSVLTTPAAALSSGSRFVQVFVGLRQIANQSKPGLGDRPVSGGPKSNYNDIVNVAFAEELVIVYVTGDQKFLNFLTSHAGHLGIQARHFLQFP